MKNKEEILKEFNEEFIWWVFPTEIAAPSSEPDAYLNKEKSILDVRDFLSEKLDLAYQQGKADSLGDLQELREVKEYVDTLETTDLWGIARKIMLKFKRGSQVAIRLAVNCEKLTDLKKELN